MYHKLLFSILFTITSCFSLVAQSKDLLYQAEIQAAQNDLKDEQFRSAIRHLEKAKSIKSQTTPTIQSLYVKSYLGLTYYDDARTALKTYFEISKEGDEGFDEMLLLLSKIDDIENEVAKKEELTKMKAEEEEKAWQKTVTMNTTQAYLDFVSRYPNNENIIKAKAIIKNNLTKELEKETVLAKNYLAKKRGSSVAKNLLFWPGLLLGAYGGIKIADIIYFDDRCIQESYDVPSGYYCSEYDYGTKGGIVFAAIGGAMMTTSFFIHPRKYKRLYETQMIKVEQVRKEVQLYSLVLKVNPSNGWAATGLGIGLSVKF